MALPVAAATPRTFGYNKKDHVKHLMFVVGHIFRTLCVALALLLLLYSLAFDIDGIRLNIPPRSLWIFSGLSKVILIPGWIIAYKSYRRSRSFFSIGILMLFLGSAIAVIPESVHMRSDLYAVIIVFSLIICHVLLKPFGRTLRYQKTAEQGSAHQSTTRPESKSE